LCISPLGCTGGVRAELLVCVPLGVYLGHLYTGESGQFHRLIFVGPVRYGAVRCGVSSDRITYFLCLQKSHNGPLSYGISPNIIPNPNIQQQKIIKTGPNYNNNRVTKRINKSHNKTRTLHLLQCSRATYQYGHEDQWWFALSIAI